MLRHTWAHRKREEEGIREKREKEEESPPSLYTHAGEQGDDGEEERRKRGEKGTRGYFLPPFACMCALGRVGR